MKKTFYTFTFLIFIAFSTTAQSVAICGFDASGGTSSAGDEFTFVLLRDFTAGEVIYFTEDEYSDVANAFDFGEGHLAYTVPVGGLFENEVVRIFESGENSFEVQCGTGGTAVHLGSSGAWSYSGSDELYAYSASNAATPWSTVTEIHCFYYGSVIAPGAAQDPSLDYPNVIKLAPNLGTGGAMNTDFNDPTRINTTLTILQNSANWTKSTNGITLSCTDFTTHMLPIELIHFDATKSDREVMLSWSTSSEINNDYFQIEHSFDGKQFEEVNKINGSGNSELINHYNFIHKDPSIGVNYYRLKEVDFDGQFEYSDIVSVKFGHKNPIVSVYPTPCIDHLHIDFDSADGAVSYQIFSVFGDILLTETIRVKVTLDIHHLDAGVYFIHVENGNNRFVHKIVKQY